MIIPPLKKQIFKIFEFNFGPTIILVVTCYILRSLIKKNLKKNISRHHKTS